MVEKAVNQKLHNELVQTQHDLAQCRKEVVPAKEYQALLNKFTDLSSIEDETFAQLKEEQAKLKRAQEQVEQAKKQITIICSLYNDAVSCRAPATNYALFLTEQYLLSKVKAIRVGKSTTFRTIEDFFHCCNDEDEQFQCLLCEL